MREYWLNTDCKILLEGTDGKQRIAITNPEALKNVSATDVWEKITGSFGKYEFEMWVAEKIVAMCMLAAADGSKTADLTLVSSAVLYVNFEFPEQDWKVFKNNESFKLVLKHLKIFKILKETPEEILLEYQV